MVVGHPLDTVKVFKINSISVVTVHGKKNVFVYSGKATKF